jgi:hypothetical protein
VIQAVTQAKRSWSLEAAVSMARLRSATPSMPSHMSKGEPLIGQVAPSTARYGRGKQRHQRVASQRSSKSGSRRTALVERMCLPPMRQ